MVLAGTLLLLLISGWYAWRYSKTEADPDWAYFNLAAFTGAWYGKDFADCKTPLVHLWYYLIAKVVGANVKRVKFAHHMLVGAGGAVVYLVSGDFWAGMAFTVLINSGWMLAFHGNVGQAPAVLFALVLTGKLDAWVSVGLMVLAVLYEPKLLLSMSIMVWFSGFWYEAVVLAAIGIVAAGSLYILYPEVWKWIWESSVAVPGRMQRSRKAAYPWAPWFTAQVFLYLMPWVCLGALARPELAYWLPAIGYAALIGTGRVIRQNHLIPLAAWVALAGIEPVFLLMLVVVDWVSSGFLLGDIWGRFYIGLREANREAKAAGEWLRDKPGSVWVNGIHSAVYIYARKKPWGMIEQAEIKSLVPERREEMQEQWRKDPPKWAVQGYGASVRFNGAGYVRRAVAGSTAIFEKGAKSNGRIIGS